MAVPCQRKCISAQPSAVIVEGGIQLTRLAITFFPMIIQDTAKLFEFFA